MANGNENNVGEIYNDLGITNLFKNIDNIQQLLEGKKTPKSNAWIRSTNRHIHEIFTR